MSLANTILPGIFWAIFGFALILNPAIRMIIYFIYCRNLKENGFKISERVITTDFYVFWYYLKNRHVGIWLDYDAKKIAIKTGTFETNPQIYDFSVLKGVELVVGESVPTEVRGWSILVRRTKIVDVAGEVVLNIRAKEQAIPPLYVWKKSLFASNEDVNSYGYKQLLGGALHMEEVLQAVIDGK